MSTFHSIAKTEVSFELLGHRHTLGPGDELELPDSHDYLVQARGLPLTAGPSPVEGAKRARSERVAPVPVRPAPPLRAVEEDAVDGERDPDAPDDGADDEAKRNDAAIERAAADAGLPTAKLRRPRR